MAKFSPLAKIEVWLSVSLCSDRFITVREETGKEGSGDTSLLNLFFWRSVLISICFCMLWYKMLSNFYQSVLVMRLLIYRWISSRRLSRRANSFWLWCILSLNRHPSQKRGIIKTLADRAWTICKPKHL